MTTPPDDPRADEGLVGARNKAKVIRNRVMVHMAMTGENDAPNWQEEAGIRSMLEYSAKLVAENERLRHVITSIENIMREGVKENDGPDRIWIDGVAHQGPVSSFTIRIFRKLGQVCRDALDAEAALTAARSHGGM